MIYYMRQWGYAHNGLEGAKIELIAQAAGVSQSLVLQQRFGNKQD